VATISVGFGKAGVAVETGGTGVQVGRTALVGAAAGWVVGLALAPQAATKPAKTKQLISKHPGIVNFFRRIFFSCLYLPLTPLNFIMPGPCQKSHNL
jgi:hypothetical protein